MRQIIKNYLTLFIGVAIVAFGLFNIHQRTGITEGGVLGAILLVEHWFNISPGIINIFLDGLCYALGVYYLGKKFLFNAILSTLSFSFFYGLFEHIGPLLPDFSSNPLAASILGGVFVGVGVGLVVSQDGAVGGDDALAQVISKVTHMNISKAYLFTDVSVLILSLSYIPFSKIIFSLITVTISSNIIGYLTDYLKT